MGLSKKDRAELRTKELKRIVEQHGVLDVIVDGDSQYDVADSTYTVRDKAVELGCSLTISVQVHPDSQYGMITIFSLRPIIDVAGFVKALKATWT